MFLHAAYPKKGNLKQTGALAPWLATMLFCLMNGLAGTATSANAEEADATRPEDASAPEQWRVYGQLTNVTQWHPSFHSPYSGANSLQADERKEETTDVTLFAGVRLGSSTEFWINPEIDQGFGLSDTVGMGGFPSGEAYKIGSNTPYLRVPRAFVRHIVSLGGEAQKIDPQPNQLAGTASSDNLMLTVGKFSVVDVFDTNTYAHDPRADFLNWSVIDAGAFDYAADPWGFTYGAAAEWTQSWWTLRGGLFQMSEVPNDKVTGFHFLQHMLATELETRHVWSGQPGKVKLLAFVNQADMANYRDALQLAQQTGSAPDVSAVRRHQSRTGAAFNLEQQLGSDLGVFIRASANDGRKEAYEFTEINRSFSTGFSLKGSRWGRTDDTAGIVGVVNALSSDAQAYCAAGGMGILIGDGALNYGPEKILETYYSLQLNRYIGIAFDFQHVNHPAYNRDRGPVNISAIRLHAQF
jgi:high affinity Mn2+ porin